MSRSSPASPGENEFHQAVHEVLSCLRPVLARHPSYAEAKVVERLREPERQAIIRVPRTDDHAGRIGADATYIAGGRIRDVPGEVAPPCATQNELDDRCYAMPEEYHYRIAISL